MASGRTFKTHPHDDLQGKVDHILYDQFDDGQPVTAPDEANEV